MWPSMRRRSAQPAASQRSTRWRTVRSPSRPASRTVAGDSRPNRTASTSERATALAGNGFTMQAHDGGGVVVGQARLGRLPDVEVQPGQPQPGPGRQDPGMAEHAPPLDPTGLLPTAEPLP